MFAFRLVTTLVAVGFCTLGAFAADFSNTVLKGRTDKENPVGQIKAIVGNIADYQPLVDRNRETALRLAPWELRMREVKEWLERI